MSSSGRRPNRAHLSAEEQRRRWAQIVDEILNDPGTAAEQETAGDGPAVEVGAQADAPKRQEQNQ